MSSHFRLDWSQFFIPRENLSKAVEAITPIEVGIEKSLTYVELIDILNSFFEQQGWSFCSSNKGDITLVEFEGSAVLINSIELFTNIAPYVRKGSFIIFHGGLKWEFNGNLEVTKETEVGPIKVMMEKIERLEAVSDHIKSNPNTTFLEIYVKITKGVIAGFSLLSFKEK